MVGAIMFELAASPPAATPTTTPNLSLEGLGKEHGRDARLESLADANDDRIYSVIRMYKARRRGRACPDTRLPSFSGPGRAQYTGPFGSLY